MVERIKETKESQKSTTIESLLFDLNLGDAFAIRIAGNVVDEDILGSMEYGAKVAGSKLIAVVGHSSCGAVKGACDDVRLGNVTGLVGRIKPAVEAIDASIQPRNSKNREFVEMVARQNVLLAMAQIREKSPLLREMIDSGTIALVGGMYDLETGKVEFFDK